jgi:chromosome segregation ATPase
MGRVTVHIADPLLSALDEEAHNRSISRSQAVANAIENFISGDKQAVLDAHNKLSEEHNKLCASDEEVKRLREELSKTSNQVAEKDKALESSSSEVMRLQEDVKRIVMLQEEAEHNKDNYDELKSKYDQLASENNSRWEETKALKSEITKQKKLFDESQATIQHLKDDLLRRQSETDQLAKTREELAAARMEADKLKESINLRNQDVAFLQGHVAQLTQSISQLSLKPGEDEIKRKGWSWRFWQR